MGGLYAPRVSQPQRGPASNAFNEAFLTGIEGKTELVLVRHGQQSVPNLPNAKLGDSVDAPLSDLGREQARLVGQRFATERVDAVYASTMRRAFDTGAAIGGHHGLKPVVIDDLREIGCSRCYPLRRPHRNAGVDTWRPAEARRGIVVGRVSADRAERRVPEARRDAIGGSSRG